MSCDRSQKPGAASQQNGQARASVFLCWLLASGFWLLSSAHATVRLHPLFSDHAVLQRDLPVTVWGWADAGERVTVSVAGQSQSVRASAEGKWSLALRPMPAGGPHVLVASGSNRVEVNDVLVGEVWVAGGQSNMNMLMRPNLPWSPGVLNYEQEIRAANWPQMRFFDVETAFAETPAEAPKGRWKVCTPEAAGEFSGTAYFFARAIHQGLNVPVGMIVSAVGATGTTAWTSRDSLLTDATGKQKIAEYEARLRRFPEELQAYRHAKAAGDNNAKEPKDPSQSIASPALLFNGMIAPLMPCTIRGVIWYQGESNTRWAHGYTAAMKLLIEDWRRRWGLGEFPFLFVQLTNHGQRLAEPADAHWARLREAQTRTLDAVPNTGMAVTIDAGAVETHPPNKQAVGGRLALVALAKVYGKPIVYSGPMFRAVSIEGSAARLQFDHVGGGLVAKGGKLDGFAVAGEDRKFVWADARIDGDTVVVSSPQVSRPVAVRYAWAENPDATLFNAEGLPASPFRTDDWPLAVPTTAVPTTAVPTAAVPTTKP